MKKQIFILVILTITLTQFLGCDDSSIFSQVKGSGNIETVEYLFQNFERVEVSNAFETTIVRSDTYSVVLFVDDNIVDYLEIQRSGDWLIIDLDDNHNYNNVTLKAEIQMPDLKDLRASGATYTTIDGFEDLSEVDDFNLQLSGASVFSGKLLVNNCDIDLSGASVINLEGSSQSLNLEASGASDLNMSNFVNGSAFFRLSGASDGTIHVTDQLDVNLSGASILRYYGDPEMGNMNISGASSLIKL